MAQMSSSTFSRSLRKCPVASIPSFAVALTPATGGGVAWWAHIGGFAGGLAFATLMGARRADYRRYYGDEGILGFTPTGVR